MPQPPASSRSTDSSAIDQRAPERRLVGWTLVAVVLLGFSLGGPALIEPDEGRNATIAAEMARTGDFVVPRLEGLPYLDKPVLFFGMIALSLELLGDSELAVRLPALLSTWLTVALVWWFGARTLGRREGVVAALAMATAPLVLAFARIAIFDATLSLLIAASLVAFYCAAAGPTGERQSADARRAQRRWRLAAWVAMGLGVLTKGPVALAVPLLVVLPWAAWRRRIRAVVSAGAFVAFLAVVCPWVIAVERELPGFLRYVLVTETWARMTSDALERSEPWWFFVPFVLAGFFPWSVVALGGGDWRQWLRRLRRLGRPGPNEEDPRSLRFFLVLWMALPFLLFSLSSSKQPQYVLPLMPALSLLVAGSWREAGARRGTLAGAVGWVVLAVPLLLAGLRVIPVETGVDAETTVGIFRTGILLGSLALVAALGAGLAARLGRARDLGLLALSLPLLLFPVVTARSLSEIAEIRSSRGIAQALAERMAPGDRLIGVESYSSTLSFYLGHRVLVSTADGAPFRSNYVLHRYDRLVDGGGALRRAGWWREVLAECTGNDFFVLDRRRSEQRSELEAAGLERFYQAFRLEAYGPCENGGRR